MGSFKRWQKDFEDDLRRMGEDYLNEQVDMWNDRYNQQAHVQDQLDQIIEKKEKALSVLRAIDNKNFLTT